MKLNFRRLLAMFLSIVMVAGMLPAAVFAEDGVETQSETNVAQVGGTSYATFDEALAAASAFTGDVTVEIYDKVTLNKALSGSYDSITFVGKDTDAEIYLDVQGYITASGKKVAFEDLTLSKSEGTYITNAGFMNVAFGVYDVVEVTYTNCTFANGAYASSGVVTFTGCTFKRSHDKYGLWAYGDVDVTVDGCTFDDYRGIKMYAEGCAKTVGLTVKNTDFSALTDKPAIVLTYGESVTLENNTYSSTGVFELDLDGAPNGTTVTYDVAPTCKNDNGACGVLVDGKIYTTVAQAAEVATSGSTVTLLHNSTETVELAEGVTLDKNGYTADGVTVKVTAPTGTVTPAYTKEVDGYVRVWGEGGGNAKKSFVLKLYSGDTLMATTKLNNVDGIIDGDVHVTWNFYYPSSNDKYWTTKWEEGHPNSAAQPTKVELYIDGIWVATTDAMMSGADGVNPVEWAELGGVKKIVTDLSGSGTAEDPYLINNLEELKWFRDDVNTYTQDGSNQYKGKYVKLTADIDLDGINWTPIGTNTVGDHAYFKGIFYGEKADGTIPTISNLYINADGDHLGFFARVGSYAEGITPTVKNLKFHNVNVSSNTTTGHGGSYVGGVIANAGGNSVVSGIEVTGDVYVAGYGYVGGIVGHGYPDIDNCHVSANDGSYIHGYYWCVGGIIGYAGEGGTPITNSSVSGVDIWSAYGAAAAVAGLLQDGNKVENVSASNVEITSNSDYCMGYIAGNGECSTMTDITANNVTVTANGQSITSTDAVASIGDAIYFDLQSAINAAQTGNQIKVLRSVTTDELTIPNGATVVLDLNGKTLNGYIAPCKPASLTISNGSIKNTNAGYSAIEINVGTLTLTDVNIESARHAVRIDGAVTATIDGGEYTLNAPSGTRHAINVSGAAEVTISDGTFVGPKGTAADSGSAVCVQSGAAVTIEGGNFSGGKNATLSVSGTLSITGGTFDQDPTAYVATGYKAEENEGIFSVVKSNTIWEVATKAELKAALYAAQDGDTIVLTADIDYGTDHVTDNDTVSTWGITKAITLDLGGHTLTTHARNFGLALRNDGVIVTNGKLNHVGTVAAIKVWDAAEISDLEIDVTGTSSSGNTIDGIVIQENAAGVDLIQDVTIHSTDGQGVDSGIKTYNCGNATEPVIGSMENVTIDAKSVGLNISAPCGTATNCSIKGGTNGIEIWIKGTYSATLDLFSCNVEGGVFAHDEFNSNPSIVNNGTLKLTADTATTGASEDAITLTIARAEKVEGILKNVMDNAQAKVNDTYYATLASAIAAAQNGDIITLIWAEGDAPIAMNGAVYGKTVTITGTATVDWSKGNLFVGRGGEGDGKVIFDGANITSSVKKNPASTGIHVSGGKGSDANTNYGTLEIKNSTIELDYLINRNATIVDGNSTLTVYGGCWTHGRDASESVSGTDETATLTIGAGSTVIVINENGMGVGGEGKGEMIVDGTYNANVLNVSAKGIVKIGGAVAITGTATNNGSIVLTDKAATLTSTECGSVTTTLNGCKVVYENGVYKVAHKAIEVTYADGTVEYFDDILEAVPEKTNLDKLEGATIKLLGDYTGSGIRFYEHNMTLDLNGHTYSINRGTGSSGTKNQCFQVRSEAANIVIKNGSIRIVEKAERVENVDIYWVFNGYCDYTLENVTVDCTNLDAATTNYVVLTSGDAQLTGNTSIVNFNGNGPSVAVTEAGSVVIDTTGAIAGGIESDGYVELKNGTVTGALVLSNAAATLMGPEGLNVTTTVDGYEVKYTDGKYTLVEVEEVEPAGTITSTGHSISLEGNIWINKYATFEGFEDIDLTKDAGLLIWTSEISEEDAVYGAEGVIVKEGLLFSKTTADGKAEYGQITDGIVAPKYGDKLYMRFYVNVGDHYEYGAFTAYSVEDYCRNKIEKSSNESLKKLCVAVLNYGAQAQIKFNHNPDDLVNAGIDSGLVTAFSDDMIIALDETFTTQISPSSNVTSNGRSISLDEGITINYYYKASGFTVKTAELLTWSDVEGELTYENAEKTTMIYTGSEYGARGALVPAAECGDTIYACARFTDTEGNVYYSAVTAYSAHQYAANQIAKGKNVDLLKAFIVYSNLANEYFNK